MKKNPSTPMGKSPTGVAGLDEITRGGLLSGRTSLVVGGAGSGKTVLGLQTLVNGAVVMNEPGIFVAFEEDSSRIIANAGAFGWDLPGLQRKNLFFLDAQPRPDLVQAGNFDLSGMLAILSAKVRKMGARRIVFDAVDVLLNMMDDPRAQQREIYRLHEWLLEENLTAIITAKAYADDAADTSRQPFGFMQFMVDCAIAMNHQITDGVSQRNIRVVKFRGSSFAEGENPFVIGERGLEVAVSRGAGEKPITISNERVSSGVQRLDSMLDGGYYRGASILITGAPGTAKSTLCGTFAEASCRRGDRTLLVTFDSEPAELVRNLASVNIQLRRFQKQNLLRMTADRTGSSSAEAHFMKIKNLAREHRANCLVIDPVSALSKQGNQMTAHSVVERLTDWAKAEGITMVCTSLLDGSNPEAESTPLQISTIADTWIHLSYVVHSGERNRALTIIKSRGTAHSNQVRELILSKSGVTLKDVYSAGGEVLMGTLRYEKEEAVRAEEEKKRTEVRARLSELQSAESEIEMRLKAMEEELAAKRAERESLGRHESQREADLAAHRSQVGQLRSSDAGKSGRRKKAS